MRWSFGENTGKGTRLGSLSIDQSLTNPSHA
jgi:hypothetical protein